ncbi:DUF5677 domain-containing protein [Burkholderia ubonensis]|uniref:DUF5677 domain-containing protein n=1 Tax=Burkholderia ubonensis TaxID=101571 RepID=UPI0012FC5D72|nr:DUF5677 domain-containing protein [Burkholderia ubonensis]
MPDLAKAQQAAKSILEIYEGLIMQAHRRDNSERTTFGSWLTLTILEQFHAALCLVDNGLESHAAGPIRSMLESAADLLNLAHCERYVDQMKYDSARENVVLFEEFGKSKSLSQEMRDTLARWDARDRPVRDQLADAVPRKLHLERKLKRVELGEVYVAYRVLCGMVHPNLTSLNARHRGSDGIAAYRAETPPEMTMMLYRLAVDLATRAVNTLPTFSNTGIDEVDAATEKAVAIWHDADPGLNAE